jgi:hypothetical protein
VRVVSTSDPSADIHQTPKLSFIAVDHVVNVAGNAANAVFDAVGRHPRQLPLTLDYIKSLIGDGRT